jgi:peroxiredoxin
MAGKEQAGGFMARLKALFVSLYPVLTLLVCGQALWLAWRDGHWLWLGVAMVNAPVLFLLGWLVSRGQARVGRYLPWATLCCWLGAAVTLLGTLSVGDPYPLAWSYTAIGLLGLCACLFWYSPWRSQARGGPRPGQALPELHFLDLDGKPVSSTTLLGAPAVLLFIRGHWCPVCMARIRELARRQPQLERRGARIVLISAQSGARTGRFARRLGVPLEWWVDADLDAARQLRILDPGGTPLGLGLLGYPGDTVIPTVIITDARGEIRYVDLADVYRPRSEPITFLRVLDNMTLAPR